MFVKLTNLAGNKIRINLDHIESYGKIIDGTYKNYKKEFEGKTFLVPAGIMEENPYVVEEAPEYIDLLLGKEGDI